MSDETWTVRRILDWTIEYLKQHGSSSPRLDAEVLLAHARGCQRIQLYTQYNEPLSEEERGKMRSLVKRRANAEPVAYLVGHREFFSLDFQVNQHVFIPRPDTETLVMQALDVARTLTAPKILELCTGSGCIAVALAKNLPQARVITVELQPATAEIARQNIAHHRVSERVELLVGDLFDPVAAGERFDLIVSNPPYIPTVELPELPPDVREHEPHVALFAGEDGLDIIRRIAKESLDRLHAGGWLMFELSPEQAPAACELLTSHGFVDVRAEKDLSGQPRVILGRRAR